ncbi:ARF-like GTPase [Selaginella moellendorffii]|uniref:ARF-like GTPase n=1 Tax=Selaginella moellendorffii TaxID=88036 RepID=D8RKG3_SELML|nr:ARF-like GTPase [Selaginella moellendorffii]
MGLVSLLKRIFKQKACSEARILVLGLDNAGKTTILRKLTNESIYDVVPTQGFNINSLLRGKFKLNVWDVGGELASRSYWRNYCDQIDGLVYVIDCEDRERLEESGEELINFLDDVKDRKFPVLVFANKQDSELAIAEDEITDALNLHYIRHHAWQVHGCSALTGGGLREGMNWLMEQLQNGT